MTDIAVKADGPSRREHWAVDRLAPPSKAAQKREHPPISETPEWAWPLAPEWDAAALTLFPQEHADARQFWAWMTDTYIQVRARMWMGYRYLEALDGHDDDAETLYQALGAWLHWLEAAWWLLTQWYGDDNRCRWLWLPFMPVIHDGSGRPPRVVREYRGLKGEVLLEEALRLWRDWAVLAHHLPDIGEAPVEAPPEPEPEPEPLATSLRPVTQRTVGTVTVGGRRIDADLRSAP
jgi:hypothetical protein